MRDSSGPAGGAVMCLKEKPGPGMAKYAFSSYAVGPDGAVKSIGHIKPPPIPQVQGMANHSEKRHSGTEGRRARESDEKPIPQDSPAMGEVGSKRQVALEKDQVNLNEIMRLSKLMLDRDSPYDKGGATWAEQALNNKRYSLKHKRDRARLEGGVETKASLAFQRKADFLKEVLEIIKLHVEKVAPAQELAKVRAVNIAAKWETKEKIPDFVNSVIAKYVTPGLGILGGAAAKLSKLWDGFMGTLGAIVSPQKKWIVDALDIAAPALAALADIAMVYFARKGLISWAANQKFKMERKKLAEISHEDERRRFAVKTEYGKMEREIMNLLAQGSQSA